MPSSVRFFSLLSYIAVASVGVAISAYLVSIRRAPLPREEISALADATLLGEGRGAGSQESAAALPWPKAAIRVSAAPGTFDEPQVLKDFSKALVAALSGSDAEISVVDAPPKSLTTFEPCMQREGTAVECLAALEQVTSKDSPVPPLDSTFDLVLVPSDDCSALLLGTGRGAVLRWHRGSSLDVQRLAASAATHLKATWLRPVSFEHSAALFEVAPAYQLNFFLVGDCRRRVAWDFTSTVLAPYLRRFLERLSLLFDLEMDSQVVQCGSLGTSLEPSEMAHQSKIGNLIDVNMLQENFMRRTGDWPPDALTRDARWLPPLIRLVAFKSAEPVHLVDAEGDDKSSFAVQGFGVVAVATCETGAFSLHEQLENQSSTDFVSTCEAQQVASAWVSSLRSWLALPPDEPLGEIGVACDDAPNSPGGLALLAARPRLDGVADWELRIVARAVHSLFVRRTAETLQDLLVLVDSLPDVVVREEIGEVAFKAVSAARGSLAAAEAGDIGQAIADAREALTLALSASQDDTVVGQLFFSWQFKWAVYLPLGLPVLVPIIVATIRDARSRFPLSKSQPSAREVPRDGQQ